MSLRCLFAASEVAGLAKTGGLADVAAALPKALAERGVEVAVIMPLYRSVRGSGLPLTPLPHELAIEQGGQTIKGKIWRTTLPQSDVPVYLIDQPDFFDRDDQATGRGLYQFTALDHRPSDYPDNSSRFGFFAQAILEAMAHLDYWPQVLHLNDWQCGLAPVYLKEIYRQAEGGESRSRYREIRTLFTIHNLAYQGLFWHWDMPRLNLPWRLFNYEQLEFYGKINFLKAGIVFADRLTTVSPTYAREIQTAIFGCGLQAVLARRTRDLTGIVNGVDYGIWNPAVDRHLAVTYDDQTVERGKAACKESLQRRFHLSLDPAIPLLGVVSRLVEQKGLDLIATVAPALLQKNVQLVVLGTGNPRHHAMLLELQKKFPGQVGVRLALDEELAHQIEAGADLFLMPSQYEPCGLNQLYSLKYGTIPIVRATGGLADTVVDANAANFGEGRATGFTFVVHAPGPFLEAINRALAMFLEDKASWRRLQTNGMGQDWSWNRSAAQYEAVYQALATQTFWS